MATRSEQSALSPNELGGWRQTAIARWLGLDRWQPEQQPVAYLFLLPSLIGFALFVMIPIVASLGLSFVEWNLTSPPQFVGIDNYVQLLTRDDIFSRVLGNTAFYVIIIVPVQLVIGLLMAAALNTGIRGLGIYRVIYFMPVVSNIVAAAMVFQWLFNQDFGLFSSWIWQLAEATGWNIQPPELACRCFLVETGHRCPDCLEKCRLYDGDLPGGVAGHPKSAV